MELRFTTLRELTELLDGQMSKDSITKALAKLVKHNEIKSIKMVKEQIYISEEFYGEVLK